MSLIVYKVRIRLLCCSDEEFACVAGSSFMGSCDMLLVSQYVRSKENFSNEDRSIQYSVTISECHRCKMCFVLFPSANALIEHVCVKQEDSVQSAEAFSDENVEPGAKYTCDKCDISFSQNSILHNHQCIYRGQRAFRCGSCGKAFQST